MHSFLK